MTRIAAVAVLLAGCLSLRPPPRAPGVRSAVLLAPAAECTALDRAHVGWGVAAAGLGALSSGGAGVAGLLTAYPTDRYAVAGTAAALGAFGVAAGFAASVYATRYTQRCPMGGR